MSFSTEKMELISKLKQGSLSSRSVAELVTKFMRKIVASGSYSSLNSLLDLLREQGQDVMQSQPNDFVVGNMITRVLKLIREEHARLMKGSEIVADPSDSLQTLWDRPPSSEEAVSAKQLRAAAIETVNELLTEIDTVTDNMAAQAVDLLSDGDTVMTYGNSNSVFAFLEAALKKRKIKILIGECAPSCSGRKLAERLGSGNNIEVIADASLFQYMTITTKVIVCAAFYKLTPKILSPSDQQTFNYLASPRHVVPFENGDIVGRAEIVNPTYDFVPSKLVSLYVTQTLANSPSYVYRLLSEQFHPEDVAQLWA